MAIFIIIVLSLLTVGIIWVVPRMQLAKSKESLKLEDYLDLENEYRKTIAQIIGGVCVLCGFIFTWLQLSATQETIIISEKRLITDRYAKALDQLGNPNKETRLGGIYALGSIAENSTDYISIAKEVLTSYIRRNYNADSVLREEFQASMDILTGKQFKISFQKDKESGINLSKTTLIGYDFDNSQLKNAIIEESNFNRSSFIKAEMSGIVASASTFIRAVCTDAKMTDSQLYGADFTLAKLNGVVMKNSNLKGAKFVDADLSNADLSGCDMSDVDINRASLHGTNLINAIGLSKSQLHNAQIDSTTKLPNYLK